jgi:hypothetical protein
MTKPHASTIQYLNVASDLLSTQSLIRELTKDKVNSKFFVITSSIERANKLCKLLDHPNVLIITTAEDFSELPVCYEQESWILITDNALEKVDSFDRSSFCNQTVLTDYLEVEQQTHWNQYQLKLKEKDSIISNDENFDLLIQQFQNYNLFTDKVNWDIIAGKYSWDWDDEVQVVSILKLELLAGFHQVIVLEEDLI